MIYLSSISGVHAKMHEIFHVFLIVVNDCITLTNYKDHKHLFLASHGQLLPADLLLNITTTWEGPWKIPLPQK